MKARSSRFRNLFLSLIAPHPQIQVPFLYRQAQIHAAISLSLSVIAFIVAVISFSVAQNLTSLVVAALVFSALTFLAYLLSRSPRFQISVWILLAGFLGIAYFASLRGPYPALLIVLTFSTLYLITNLLPLKWMSIVIYLNALLITLIALLFIRNITSSEMLTSLLGVFTIGTLTLLFAWYRNNLEQIRLEEIYKVQKVIEERERQLEVLQTKLQIRYTEIQFAAEVGRTISQIRALDELLENAVERICERFGLYYVQIYLVNPSQTYLELYAGSGEVGKILKSRRHRLPLNTTSINGTAAVEKKSQVITDTRRSLIFKPNPLLPETRAEMAVPLIVSDRVLGVLDMQSREPYSLTEEMLPAFETLAGQLAIAIQNARLLVEAEQARREAETYARRLERQSWQEYLDSIHQPEQIGYLFEQNQVLPLADSTPEDLQGLSIPITIGQEQIGSMIVELEENQPTPQAIELLQAVSRRVAEHLENLRLLENAERYRLQAEEAARRLTREGWEKYLQAKEKASPLGYLYDLKETKPLSEPISLPQQNVLNAPLIVQQEKIGQITILDAIDDLFAKELVTTIAERLSDHLENIRLLEETQRGQIELDRRARQLQAVAEISTIASREQEIQSILRTVAQLTRQKFNLYHTRIYIYDPRHETLRATAFGWAEGVDENLIDETIIPLAQEQSLVARAARTRQSVVVNDVQSDAGWLPNPLLPATRAELAIPLIIGDELLGVLDVQSEHVGAFSQEDIDIQLTLAAQVATALQNARNYERARRQAEREALLNAISQKIQSATTVEAVLQIAARELGRALNAPRTIVQLSLKES
ncbi:MAG: GAF domain-containing protein [Anaerolineales bacterium]|nr:GAF domain-containing protein [Anaerolineales bacterium]MCX7608952.1 GAF domain-containing protein [Anaerolineales bacterium]